MDVEKLKADKKNPIKDVLNKFKYSFGRQANKTISLFSFILFISLSNLTHIFCIST